MSVICYTPDKFEKIGISLSCLMATEFKREILRILGSFEDAYSNDQAIREFLHDLHVANVGCFNGQYDESARWEEINFHRQTPMRNIALLKSLDGLSYNLIDNGGKEYSRNDCYEKLEKLRTTLAPHIISCLPEYQDAKTW